MKERKKERITKRQGTFKNLSQQNWAIYEEIQK